ncbi:MAG: PEP-CTERM sorting domain-containing protein [Akkermansia sp.]
MNITRPILSLACSLLLAPALFAAPSVSNNGFVEEDWILHSGKGPDSPTNPDVIKIDENGHIVTNTDLDKPASFEWNTQDGKNPFVFEKGDVLKMEFSLKSETGALADNSSIKLDLGTTSTNPKKYIDIIAHKDLSGNTTWWVSFEGHAHQEIHYRGGNITISLENQGDGKIHIAIGEEWMPQQSYDFTGWEPNTNPKVDIVSSDADTITFKSFEKTKAVPEPTTVVLSLIGMMGLCARRRRVA